MIELFQTLWKLPVFKDQFIMLVIIGNNMITLYFAATWLFKCPYGLDHVCGNCM